MENGVVKHYHPDQGYGFLLSERDEDARRVDETKLVYFDISNCDIQTPAPFPGEVVVFSRDLTAKKPKATALIRITSEDQRTIARSTHRNAPPAFPNTNALKVSPMQERANVKIDNEHEDSARTVTSVLEEVDSKRQRLAELASVYQGGTCPRYVYVDLDGMYDSYLSAEHLVARYPGANRTRDLEINLDGFTRRVAQGEPGSAVVRLVAFYSKTPECVASKLRKRSFEGVSWDVRKHAGPAAASMEHELLNAKRSCEANAPKALVLVIGTSIDTTSGGVDMNMVMNLYRAAGWRIEVHAWLSTMPVNYIEQQRKCPEGFVIRPIDDDDVGELIRPRDSANARSTPRVRPTTAQREATPSRATAHREATPPRAAITTANTPKNCYRPQTSGLTIKSGNPVKISAQGKCSSNAVDTPQQVRSSTTAWSSPQQHKQTSKLAPSRAAVTPTAFTSHPDSSVSPAPINVRQQRNKNAQWSQRDRRTPVSKGNEIPVGTKSFAQAVGRQASEVRATSHTSRVSSAPVGRVTINKVATTSYRPEQYAKVIQELDGPDGVVYIPTALAMLQKRGTLDTESLRHADTDTQRLLLSMSLNDAMDAETRRLLEEEPVF